MNHYQLRSKQPGVVLYEGRFQSFTHCLEHAVAQKIILDQIDLSHQNLTNANLDDAVLPGADFTNTNLSGANLSEAYLKGANFKNSALYNACLYDSNITACNFDGASFGATDIHGAILSHSQFSTLSCFNLDFSKARNMNGCVFINPDGRICTMSKPPIVIYGAGTKPIIFMDEDVKAGHNIIDQRRIMALAGKLSMRTLKHHLGTGA